MQRTDFRLDGAVSGTGVRTFLAQKRIEPMKGVVKLAVVLAVAASCFGCKAFRTLGEQRINAQGAPYELIVVATSPNGRVRWAIRCAAF